MAERDAGRDADLATPKREGRRWWRFGGRSSGASGRDDRGSQRRQLDADAEERKIERESKDRLGRLMEAFARSMGTPAFLIALTIFCVAWLVWNTMAPESLRFDSVALGFTALTLMLSLQASYAAPMLLLAQNRQDDRDRVQIEQDRQRAERNTADLEYLAREIVALRMVVADMASKDFIRAELRGLLEDLEELDAADDDDDEPATKRSDASERAARAERVLRQRAAIRRAHAAEGGEFRERDESERRRRAKVRREAEANTGLIATIGHEVAAKLAGKSGNDSGAPDAAPDSAHPGGSAGSATPAGSEASTPGATPEGSPSPDRRGADQGSEGEPADDEQGADATESDQPGTGGPRG